MDRTVFDRLQGALKTRSTLPKSTSTSSTGEFRINSFDPDWYWALITITAQDAADISTIAKLSDDTDNKYEAKFAAAMIEDYLRMHAPGADRDNNPAVKECKAHGRKFLPGKSAVSNVWLLIGLSERLARVTRELLRNRPGEANLTDYQMVSEILRLATVDLRGESAAFFVDLAQLAESEVDLEEVVKDVVIERRLTTVEPLQGMQNRRRSEPIATVPLEEALVLPLPEPVTEPILEAIDVIRILENVSVDAVPKKKSFFQSLPKAAQKREVSALPVDSKKPRIAL